MSDHGKDLSVDAGESIQPAEQDSTAAASTNQKLVQLSNEDHAIVAYAVAGIPSPTTTGDSATVARFDILQASKSSLYSSIVHRRRVSKWQYKCLAFFYNVALVIQLFFGAALTALSSAKSRWQLAATILAAANTINAGLLALMHNSGLPDRLKNDFREFDKVQQHVKALVQTGIVREGWSKEEAIADCWEQFASAKEVVGRNKPAIYRGSEPSKIV